MPENATEKVLDVFQRGPGNLVLPTNFLRPRLHMMSLDFPEPSSVARRL
jgi:hypothetical protein